MLLLTYDKSVAHNKYDGHKQLYEDLRALAVKHKICFKFEAKSKQVPRAIDCFIALQQTPREDSKSVNFVILKQRKQVPGKELTMNFRLN